MWNDWVWVDYGKKGKFPCEIWCFVVLEGMPKKRRDRIFIDGEYLEDGTYAVCESAKVDAKKIENKRSKILIRCSKVVELDEDNSQGGEKEVFLGRHGRFSSAMCSSS